MRVCMLFRILREALLKFCIAFMVPVLGSLDFEALCYPPPLVLQTCHYSAASTAGTNGGAVT